MLADGSEYRGRYGRSVAQLRDFHRERLAVLAGTTADVLAIETIPEVEEAAALAGLLAEMHGAAAWVTFTCADGARIRSGAPIEEAVAAVAGAPGVVAVGVNCTAPEHVPELVGGSATTPPGRRLPEQRRGLGRDASPGTGAAAGRVDGAAAGVDRRGRAAGRRLLPGDAGPGRVLADGLPAHAAARP